RDTLGLSLSLDVKGEVDAAGSIARRGYDDRVDLFGRVERIDRVTYANGRIRRAKRVACNEAVFLDKLCVWLRFADKTYLDLAERRVDDRIGQDLCGRIDARLCERRNSAVGVCKVAGRDQRDDIRLRKRRARADRYVELLGIGERAGEIDEDLVAGDLGLGLQ